MKQNLISALSGALFLLLGLVTNVSFSQQNGVIRCYTTEMDSIRHANDPTLQSNDEFENWLAKLINEKATKPQPKLIINGVYQIPVVVHVIHNGEAVGTGTNLSQAAIQSQIDVLNEDFRKIFGTAGYNTHPFGADTKIEFCLAKRRPDGSAFPGGEDGINRVNRSTAGFTAPPYTTAYIDGTIKPWSTGTDLGGWDAAEYMNFWSIDISGGILGYAQFPTTSLGGMSCNPQSASTDGVVMLYSSIGKSSVTGQPGPYNEGRTATHEIGHWLGLRHIWGDGGCGVDDFCADTPLSDASNFGCPTTNSCTDPNGDPNDMVENYMDYTDDACMNIFTYDQMARMRTVLENSPIRASLINSDACIPPAVSDASIINILNPNGDNCPGAIAPQVTMRNRGSSNLTSATIAYTIDGGTPTTFSWTGSIAPGAEANVTLPAFTATYGVHTIKAYNELPNGVTDPDPTYDTTTLQFAVSNGYQPNYTQDFEAGTFPPDVRWSIDNPNGDCFEWIGQSSTSSAGTFPNDAAAMVNFGNTSGQDEFLYTPIFILPCNATSAEVVFDKAYRRRAAGSNDRLRLEMSTDCGATWSTVLYDQSGTGLQSVNTTSNTYWIPSAAGDWDNVVVDLSTYVTGVSQNVQFRFRGTNQGTSGGNIYVDNFEFNAVTPGEIEVDVAGTAVLDEGYYDYGTIGVGATVTATFTITNTGTSNLTLTGPINVTGTGFTLNTTFGTTTVAPGATTTFSVDFTAASAGTFTGNVSFGTNDCDEGTYNFQLLGQTNTNPPIANFSGTPTTVCQGSTVTYTDASTGASSWNWTFPGGTPATATGVGPHTVTYNTAGTFDAQLSVTNPFGTDNLTQTGYITVLPGTGATLPISEGFEGGVAPTNWSINNGGNAITWVQDTPGNAPTATNSASIDNFNTNTTGQVDDLVVEPFDLTGYVSATLTFDVAYAQYDNTYNDQLDVLVSNDCGQSFATVYSKAGTTLATDPNQTTAYTANTWRTETIDLTPYVGAGKVDVLFRNISGWGQFLFIDNVNITGVVSSATADFTAAPDPACVGETVTFTDASTNATSWDWNFGAGATPATATGAGPHDVVYSTSGTKNVSLDVNSGASVSNQTVTINPLPTPTITASGVTTFCAGGSVTLTSSSTTGNLWSTGETTQSIVVSTSGSYTVSVTDANGCTGTSAATTVTVNPAPAAPVVTASGSTTFCTGGSVDLTSDQATGNLWSTGETTQTITVSASGSYSVTYTDGNGCSATSAATTVTVNPLPATPTITASGSTTFCAGGSVDLTSSATTGNGWSTLETTQTITVSTSGTYSVTVTDGNGCQATSAPITVTVNPAPTAPVVTASGSTTFCAGGSVDLTSDQATGNLWSTGETTQTITVSASGSYTVTYTDGNGCSATSAATTVTVNPLPATPTITASGANTFCAGGSVDLTSDQATGNLWSTGETTQTITVSTSGTYSVTYTDGNGCSATSAATTVTVNPTPVIATGTITDPSTCGGTDGSIVITGTGTGQVGWAGTASGTSGVVTLPYTITGLAQGPYTIGFVDANSCVSNTLNVALNDPASAATPVITASGATTFCAGGSVTLTSDQATGNVWSTGETTQSITVSTSGSYTVTYTNGSGCSATSAATTVTVNPLPATPTITASGSTTFCAGGSVDLTSSATTGNGWSTLETTQTITVSTSGTYSVTVTDGNGCQATSAPITVTVNPAPTAPVVTASGSTTFCAGGSVDLTSDQATGNLWSTGETTQTITVSASGSYSVTYTDGNGCSATSSTSTVTVNPAPTAPVVTASGSTTFCAGGSVDLTSDQATGNLWSTGETTQTITVSASGSYSVTYTDGNGCSATSAATTVTVNPTPTAPVVTASGATTFCDGGSIDLTSDQATGNVWSTGETTQTITVSTSGTYSVTYTDGNGCSATSAATTVTVNPTPVIATGTITDPSTCGATDGSIVINGSATGTVTWTGSASGTSGVVTLPYTISGLGAGGYTIDFVDGNGCSATSLNQTLTDPTPAATPVITASGATTFCAGGSVTLTSDQATGNVWSTGETTQSITVSTSGSYTVTYTNGSGCSATSAATTVTVNPLPATPTITASGSTTFCAGGSVDLTSSATAGNGWSTLETTQTITVSTSGTYSVTVTDGNGCQATSAPITVTVNPAPTAPVVTASGSITFCAGGSVDLTSDQATGNLWSTGETTQTITVSASGSYSVTYTDGNGCSATSAATTVTVNPLPATPTITASGSTTFCAGGSVDLTSSATTGNGWSTLETTQTITVSTSGTYSVTVTDGNGCQATSAPITVTVNPAPTAPVVTASGSTTFCAGGSVDLTSDQATGNLWSTGETTQTITVSASGSYSVTYTDGNGCSATSAATTVTVNPAPTAPVVTASGSTTFCDGGSIDLTSDQVTGNVWSTGETTQTITVSASGTYSVTYTDGNGCSATSSATTVTVNPTPVISTGTVTDPTTCGATDGSIVINGSATGTVTWTGSASGTSGVVTLPYTISGLAGGSYSVDFVSTDGCSSNTVSATLVNSGSATTPVVTTSGATTFCAGGSVTLTSDQATGNLWSTGETTQSITVSTSGSYSVTYTNGSGCSATSAATTVTVNPLPATPTITASGSTTFCAGGSVDLTSSATAGNGWSTLETTQTITVSTSGTYSVTVTDGNGCQATSAPITVIVNPAPTAPVVTASGSTTFCAGGSVDLTSSQATGNVWSNGSFAQTINVTNSGNYSVTYTDANGCQATSAPITVTVNPLPTAPVVTASGATTFCQGGSVDLTSDQTTGNVWSTGATTPSINVTSTGTYSVVYTDANGCSATSTPVSVVVNALPNVNAGPDQAVCDGESVILTGSGAQAFTWNNGVTNGVSFVPTATATYTVTGTDANGCSNTDQVDVVVNPLPTVTLTSPIDTTCNNADPVTLSASPAGGTYSGATVVGDVFDPVAAGAGTYDITYSYTDANGCDGSATVTIVVDNCLSIDENAFATLEVYPNPMSDELMINLDGNFTYELVDARGRLIFKGDGVNEAKVNTSEYEMGVYFVNIFTNENATTVRVLKQ